MTAWAGARSLPPSPTYSSSAPPDGAGMRQAERSRPQSSARLSLAIPMVFAPSLMCLSATPLMP
eukprot:3287042-Prymnesium_polylepis.1